MLESVGIDVIPDHKEDCPYYRHPTKRRHSKLPVLKRDSNAFDVVKAAPLASSEATTSPSSEEARVKMEEAVQCGGHFIFLIY
ncbi:hypothetical protein ANCDUO_23120 [Ancylostoma duodenale]|uniref:Uncharacterized protein n=1 Tax=Ancylostoma duodenale TaxID=51022 RepID=A0A0C2FE58_9BILA|nr:hypothetical protein ANCDUO_23120 [Ancylostoma duodenale]